MVLANQRGLFEVSDDVVYLNTANMSPLLRSVRAAGEAALARRAAPWAIPAEAWFTDVERLRSNVARLINADPDGVALVPATSYGLAIAAANLEAGTGRTVVVLHDEFPSSYYTWRRFVGRTGAELVVVPRHPGQAWEEAVLASIDERTAVVVVPNVHWTDGSWVDLPAVKARCDEVGAAMVVDASQSMGAIPLDVDTLRPDFVVSVGYKWLLGPVTVGYLYVDERHRAGRPIEENWINRANSDDFTALADYTEDYRPGARRFDVGQRSNLGSLPMAIAALDQLLEWGVADVAATLQMVTDRISTQAQGLGLTVAPPDARGPHMLGIEVPPDEVGRVATALQDKGVVLSQRGSVLRVAPHLHTSAGDVDRLVAALRSAL